MKFDIESMKKRRSEAAKKREAKPSAKETSDEIDKKSAKMIDSIDKKKASKQRKKDLSPDEWEKIKYKRGEFDAKETKRLAAGSSKEKVLAARKEMMKRMLDKE